MRWTKRGLAMGCLRHGIGVIFLRRWWASLREIAGWNRRSDALIQRRETSRRLIVTTRALLHTIGEQAELLLQLLLGGVDAGEISVQEIQTGPDLVEGGLRRRRCVTHGLKDELCLRGGLGRRRGENPRRI
jgi:hypothetical protein